MIETVFFDLGFTLLNFDGDFYSSMIDSYSVLTRDLISSGINIDSISFSKRFGAVLAEYYKTRELNLVEVPIATFLVQVLAEFKRTNVPTDIIESAVNAMYECTEPQWVLEDDTLPTLERLRSAGYTLGIVTNAANERNSNRLIDQCRLRPYFKAIVISAVEKVRKPDPRIYQCALELAGAKSPASAVMVGDTLIPDIAGAQNSGLRAIWLTRRASRPENDGLNAQVKPDAIAATLSEIPELLKRLS